MKVSVARAIIVCFKERLGEGGGGSARKPFTGTIFSMFAGKLYGGLLGTINGREGKVSMVY